MTLIKAILLDFILAVIAISLSYMAWKGVISLLQLQEIFWSIQIAKAIKALLKKSSN